MSGHYHLYTENETYDLQTNSLHGKRNAKKTGTDPFPTLSTSVVVRGSFHYLALFHPPAYTRRRALFTLIQKWIMFGVLLRADINRSIIRIVETKMEKYKE